MATNPNYEAMYAVVLEERNIAALMVSRLQARREEEDCTVAKLKECIAEANENLRVAVRLADTAATIRGWMQTAGNSPPATPTATTAQEIAFDDKVAQVGAIMRDPTRHGVSPEMREQLLSQLLSQCRLELPDDGSKAEQRAERMRVCAQEFAQGFARAQEKLDLTTIELHQASCKVHAATVLLDVGAKRKSNFRKIVDLIVLKHVPDWFRVTQGHLLRELHGAGASPTMVDDVAIAAILAAIVYFDPPDTDEYPEIDGLAALSSFGTDSMCHCIRILQDAHKATKE